MDISAAANFLQIQELIEYMSICRLRYNSQVIWSHKLLLPLE